MTQWLIDTTSSQVAKLQTEVRRLQDSLEEKRLSRLESSENILEDARLRIQSLRDWYLTSLTFDYQPIREEPVMHRVLFPNSDLLWQFLRRLSMLNFLALLMFSSGEANTIIKTRSKRV
jgi:hypothetical protein